MCFGHAAQSMHLDSIPACQHKNCAFYSRVSTQKLCAAQRCWYDIDPGLWPMIGSFVVLNTSKARGITQKKERRIGPSTPTMWGRPSGPTCLQQKENKNHKAEKSCPLPPMDPSYLFSEGALELRCKSVLIKPPNGYTADCTTEQNWHTVMVILI